MSSSSARLDPKRRRGPPANDPWSHSGFSSGGPAAAATEPPDRGDPSMMRDEPPPPADDIQPSDLQVIFAACAGRGGHLGLAYVDLDAPERVLHVTDTLDPTFAQLHRLKHAVLGRNVQQGLCVVPSKSPPELLEQAALPIFTSEQEMHRAQMDSFPVAVLKSTDFDVEACRQRLLLLRDNRDQGKDHAGCPTAELELREQVKLDFASEQMIRAAGGLARFMERNRAHLGDLDDPKQVLHVHSIRLFSMENSLFVDMQTMSALQVFSEEHHPSYFRGPGRSKEGLSLFGLLEPFVASATGRATLRRWLQQPYRDLSILGERHDAVEELVRQGHRELLRELHREMREVHDLAGILRRVFGCYHFDNVRDWRLLTTTLEHMSSAFALLRGGELGAAIAPLHDLRGLAEDTLVAEDMLHHFVDATGSGVSGAEVHIRAGVDEQLDAVRDQYETIDGYLTEVAQLERRRLRDRGVSGKLPDTIAFHYFPQLGFHVSVPNPLAEAGNDGDVAAMEELKRASPAPDEDWRYQFAGGARLFYKCTLASRLDAEIGDLVVAIRDLELELLLGVVERLRRFEPRLCSAAQLIADFDVLCAFAVAALQLGWARPRFSKDPRRLYIKRGRHPLTEEALGTQHGFVPNDTRLGMPPTEEAEAAAAEGNTGSSHGDAKATEKSAPAHVQVVTGANLAGKSVYLKQVGLIVLLAQVGSFVPAEEAELGLCDFIFSRIQSLEGAAVRCSSFGLDLLQVSQALKHSTSASLVLLDEFGKGTQAADGVALLGSTVEYLCRQKNGPKVIVTTHFTEVFKFQLVSETEPGLQLCSMRVLPPEGNGGDVAYLYQLVPGIAERSFGIECARRAGLGTDTLARAEEILAALERGEAVPPPKSGPLAEAAARADARRARRGNACRVIIDRLCSISPDDGEAARALLGFVRSQEAFLQDAAAAA